MTRLYAWATGIVFILAVYLVLTFAAEAADARDQAHHWQAMYQVGSHMWLDDTYDRKVIHEFTPLLWKDVPLRARVYAYLGKHARTDAMAMSALQALVEKEKDKNMRVVGETALARAYGLVLP